MATWPARTWQPAELVTAGMMNSIRDQLNELHEQILAIPPVQTKPTLPASIAYEDESNVFVPIQQFNAGMKVYGGSGTLIHSSPIEILGTSHPRVGFHWQGVIASSLGMDSTGAIRTYNNPGTGYEAFVAAAITAVGDLRATGSVGCDTNQWRSNFHPSGYIYPGAMTAPTGVQSSWCIQGHSSYGLYINTGLCLAGGLWTTTHVTCGTSMSVGTTLSVTGAITFPINVWNTSAETYQRLFYAAHGATYFKSPTSINFRTGNVDTTDVVVIGSASAVLDVNGMVQSRWGFRCQAGVYGAQAIGNTFNFMYTGAIQTWIDATYFGDLFLAQPSDARIKRDFTPLAGGSLDKILKMRPGSFYFLPFSHEFDADPRQHLGLLAQEVQAIAPEIVYNMDMKTPTTPDGALRVEYMEIIPMLIAAIQELNRKVEKVNGRTDTD